MIKNMLNFKTLFAVLLFAGIMSCNKEDFATEDDGASDITVENLDLGDFTDDIASLTIDTDIIDTDPEGLGDRKKCFLPIFPVTIIFPDETLSEANSIEELKEAMIAWKEANPDVDGRPTLQLPFDAVLDDGTTVTFTTEEEVRAAIKDCVGDRPHRPHFEKCLTPVFPITIVFPDETTAEVNSKEEFKEAMIAWKEANPDVDGRPNIQFPFDATLEDGTVVTITSKEDLMEILKSCKGDSPKGPHYKRCFYVIFPVTVELPNGEMVEVDSKEAMKELILDWKENNPDSNARPKIAFPFDVKLKNGEIITISNKEDLVKILKKCKRKKKKDGHDPH